MAGATVAPQTGAPHATSTRGRRAGRTGRSRAAGRRRRPATAPPGGERPRPPGPPPAAPGRQPTRRRPRPAARAPRAGPDPASPGRRGRSPPRRCRAMAARGGRGDGRARGASCTRPRHWRHRPESDSPGWRAPRGAGRPTWARGGVAGHWAAGERALGQAHPPCSAAGAGSQDPVAGRGSASWAVWRAGAWPALSAIGPVACAKPPRSTATAGRVAAPRRTTGRLPCRALRSTWLTLAELTQLADGGRIRTLEVHDPVR